MQNRSRLVGITVTVIIIAGIIYPHGPSRYFLGVFLSRSVLYDQSFIEAIRSISNFVPKNSTLLVSASAPVIEYFSGHTVMIPRSGVDSHQSLLHYMSQHNITYLVVVVLDGTGSSVEMLKPLFSSQGLKRLDDNFKKMQTLESSRYIIYIYKKNMSERVA